MNLTQIEKSFKKAMEDLSSINGRISVLDSFVNQTKSRIENDERVGHELISSALPFRNITLDKKVNNLFLVPNYYELNRSNLKTEVEMIISRECLFQISQAYEILETFLYDQVTELIRLNNNLNLFIDSKSNNSTHNSIRKALKGFNERKNNRHLITMLRANCPVFSEYEKNNIYDLDFNAWYEMLSEVRHCITHNRTEITQEIKSNTALSYSLYFKTANYGGNEVVFMEFSSCTDLISRIADFIFFVFKAVTEKSLNTIVDFRSVQQIIPAIYQ